MWSLFCCVSVVQRQAVPEVVHVEEVRTSSEEDARSLGLDTTPDHKPCDNKPRAAASSDTASRALVSSVQETSANNSANTDESVLGSGSEKLRSSSSAATDDASLTASSASDDKPVADSGDDNPELTLSVASSCSFQFVC